MKGLKLVSVFMLIICSLFISCSNEVTPSNGTAAIRFIGTDDSGARSLNKTNPEFKAGDYYWMYTAVKNAEDPSGLKTGETTEKTPLGTDGKITNSVGPFSLGVWDFTLYAYNSKAEADEEAANPTDIEKRRIAYTGSVTATITNSANSVSVTVNPLMTSYIDAEGKGQYVNGRIAFPDKGAITLKDENGNMVTNYKEFIYIEKIESGILIPSTSINYSTIFDTYGTRTLSIDSGFYKITMKYTDSTDTTRVYGENSIYVNVWDNLTTTIGGSLDENKSDVVFDPDSPILPNEGSATGTVEADTATSISVGITPSNDAEKTTTVYIPANATGESTGTAKLSVKTYAPDSAADFTVEANETAIGGLDLNLTVGDSSVSTFTSGVTVTTYITKELSNIDVKYNGTGEKPSSVTYEPSTGKLTFTTTHFSEFYVVTTGSFEAINTITNTAYKTLKEALERVNTDDIIILLKDVEYASANDLTSANAFTINKACTINGNGYGIIYNNAETVSTENLRLLNISNLNGGTVLLNNLEIYYTISPTGFSVVYIYDNPDLTLKLDNVAVSIPSYYAINIDYSNTSLVVNIKDSKIQGWATIYNHASGVNLKAENSVFNSANLQTSGGDSNSFTNVVVAEYYETKGSGDSNNNKFVFNDCTFSAKKPDVTDVTQVVFDIRSPYNNTLELNNCTLTETAEPYYIMNAFDTFYNTSTTLEKRREMFNKNTIKVDGVDVKRSADYILNYMDTPSIASDIDLAKYEYPCNPLPMLYGFEDGTTEVTIEINNKKYNVTATKTVENPETWTITYVEDTTVATTISKAEVTSGTDKKTFTVKGQDFIFEVTDAASIANDSITLTVDVADENAADKIVVTNAEKTSYYSIKMEGLTTDGDPGYPNLYVKDASNADIIATNYELSGYGTTTEFDDPKFEGTYYMLASICTTK